MSDVEEEFECDTEEFQDATDVQPVFGDEESLEKATAEAQIAIDYFFNNKFDEARALMAPKANSSLYHSLGNSVFIFLEAILTFDHEQIVAASEALKKSIAFCNRYRRKNTITDSLGKMVKKANYQQYSEIEAHAELCFAECLLLKSLLTFMEDETLSSFIKAGFKIRSCYGSYKECQNILLNCSWPNSPTMIHFEGGVRMGIGTFNLMISLLPSRIIKLLEFIGFSGNKQLGIEDLEKGYRMNGLRRILCVMTLLAYNLYVVYVLSHKEGDLKICEEILNNSLSKHPNGVWFLFFKGRMEFLKGDLASASEWYIRSWKSQDQWPQFHHLCFWELTWLHCIKSEWKLALSYTSHLLEGSRWSRSIYSYQKAILLYEIRTELSNTESMVIENLMKDCPKYKQRVAGKSLPMEKFVIKKSERYFAQNKSLVLPIIELMYLWNFFKMLDKSFDLAQAIFKIIEKEQIVLNSQTTPAGKFDADNKALVLLLKGACLRQMGSPLQAIECLETAISLQKSIVEDSYIVPYAIVELALIEWDQHNQERSMAALEDAKKNYTGYSLESRLHFKIHSALTDFRGQKEEACVTKL